MTCIIGLEANDTVYIGGDAMSSSGWDKSIVDTPKVFRRADFLIGYTSSFRMGQLLQYHLAVRPPQEGEADEEYMVVAFIEAARGLFKDRGYTRIDSNTESGGVFLAGYNKRLYRVDSDFQVTHYANGLAAVGAGEQYALGAMLAMPNAEPEARILAALTIAEQLCNRVTAPFTIMKM